MSSGPCTVTGGGACFRSPNYPNDYGSSEDCAISVSGAGSVRATAFATDSVYTDYVTIGGTYYGGTGPALATTGVAVSDGGTVGWTTASYSPGASGFEICGFDACGQHGSSGGGTTCVCIGGYTGALCEVRTAPSGDRGLPRELA